MPSFEGDFEIPPAGSPETAMPWDVQPRGSTTYKSGVYDVHVLVVDTDDGPAPWDEAEARRQIGLLDSLFDAETDGKFRFRLGSFQQLPPYPGRLCGSPDALAHAAPEVEAITLSPGATDALPVVVGRWPDTCAAAGMARLGSPGAWVSDDPTWFGFGTKVLIHEIGHNLGLLHSGAMPDVFTGDPWPSGQQPPSEEEYGDGSDIMGGGGQYSCGFVTCTFNLSGLHGHNRNVLQGVSAEGISFVAMPPAADAGQLVNLVAEESGETGVQLYYLPWRNRSMFLIEYRPAVGQDRHIADQGGPGAGVHVRLVGSRVSAGPPAYPEQSMEWTGTVAFPAGKPADEYAHIPIAFGAGQPLTLPDGTTVEVVSAMGSQASVRVVRQPDVTAPTMSPPRIEYAGGACTRYPCKVPATASKKGKYRLWLTYGGFTDDQWVASVKATVNGVEALADERPSPDGTDEEGPMSLGSRYWGAWRTYSPGTYDVTYTYRDLAGNEGTSSYQLVLPKPKARR